MYIPAISKEIFKELKAAEEKFPEWPTDVIHAAAIVAEESGELVKAAIDFHYGRGSKSELLREAVQTGAMAFRFLIDLEHYASEVPSIKDIEGWKKEGDRKEGAEGS
ncbi:hypothetical protein LCGC14_2197380 [marine sediment metagenome]|uniref:NTP pyrophosphohydrolase MazG putative catalytic core domain-containing protein n=1 Tax=marine sediment metagenome TaxID=412755 RepID=A0A0F9GDH4_9ZZZZ|nr:hypothetical protein [bacterium]